jgi:signal transduction histidine kinase
LVILGGFYLARALVWLTGVGETWGGLMDELGVVAQLAAPVMIVYGMLRAGLTTSAVGDLFGSFPADPRSLEAALARTLQDPTLRLVSRAPDGQWRDGTGSAVELPSDPTEVTHVRTADGEPQAALVHDRGLEPSAVSAAAAVVGLLLENQSLSQEVAAQLDEVQASRARIVEAGYRERRRVERDLHDGAQQRLLSVALALRMAQREVEAGSQAAPATIAQANDELRLAIDELRELARGIHPSILTDAGLGAAVRALAGRCPVPVDDLHLPDGRFPTGVEATAYFVVAEALTNIAKHAQATTVGVRIEADDAWLRVTITDDGVGGASPALGTGLRGLRDRVEAAGGALQVTSPAGAGTTITAELPIREEES